MSREIKFRAWCESLKLMQAPFDLVKDKGMLGALGEIHNEDYELMQNTGLKDKNGVEIYEGDVLGMKLGGPLTYGLVVFEDAAFMMKKSNIESLPNLADVLRVLPGYEVIGNIYEHPELLKEL